MKIYSFSKNFYKCHYKKQFLYYKNPVKTYTKQPLRCSRGIFSN